jgi:ribokinase
VSSRPILVLGSANLDLVVRVDRPPLPGETVFARSFDTVPGGKGLNQAVACARAGGGVRFSGAVGRDGFGDRLIAQLDAEGIDATAVRRTDAPTGTAHITVDASGQNAIVVASGANADVDASVLPASADGVRWLITQLELPAATVAAALSWCRRLGVRAVLTPAPVSAVEPEMLGLVDLLVPNQLEAAALAGTDDPVVAADRLSRRAGDVVITLGAEGSLWAQAGLVRHVEPALAVEAVDTTGAGDAYVGALVARLAEGAAMPVAMRWASAAAAIAVTRPGATSSLPTRDEVASLLRRSGR